MSTTRHSWWSTITLLVEPTSTRLSVWKWWSWNHWQRDDVVAPLTQISTFVSAPSGHYRGWETCSGRLRQSSWSGSTGRCRAVLLALSVEHRRFCRRRRFHTVISHGWNYTYIAITAVLFWYLHGKVVKIVCYIHIFCVRWPICNLRVQSQCFPVLHNCQTYYVQHCISRLNHHIVNCNMVDSAQLLILGAMTARLKIVRIIAVTTMHFSRLFLTPGKQQCCVEQQITTSPTAVNSICRSMCCTRTQTFM